MNGIPLIVTLLIITAIVTQTVAFLVTLWIQRKRHVEEDKVLNFADYSKRFDKNEFSEKPQPRKPTDE